MAKILDGRKIAQFINDNVKPRIAEMYSVKGFAPRLVSISVGNSKDAEIYVNMQKKTAERVGIEFVLNNFPTDISIDNLRAEIDRLNSDKNVTGIIAQKPLPEGICHDTIVERISPGKDVEGLHPFNLGKIFRREADIVPCTPGAVMKIISSEGIDLYGKEVVIIGHSAIVGKPLAVMMLNETATTTVCHIGTSEKGDIKYHSSKADILIVAVGKSGMVKRDWVKEGAIIIDVGINKTESAITGDVDFESVEPLAGAITPVPGGVGPVTVSILMRNVLRAYGNQDV